MDGEFSGCFAADGPELAMAQDQNTAASNISVNTGDEAASNTQTRCISSLLSQKKSDHPVARRTDEAVWSDQVVQSRRRPSPQTRKESPAASATPTAAGARSHTELTASQCRGQDCITSAEKGFTLKGASKVVHVSGDCTVDCENNMWLAGSKTTTAGETRTLTVSRSGKRNGTAGNSPHERELLMSNMRAGAVSKTISDMCTSDDVQVKGYDIAAEKGSSCLGWPNLSKALLKDSKAEQLGAEKNNETGKSWQTIGTPEKLAPSTSGKLLAAKETPLRPKHRARSEKPVMDRNPIAKNYSSPRSEVFTALSDDSESTTASSSRRSSGLSQKKGKSKCLEELVPVEEEWAEQQVRFDCLENFCEVSADIDHKHISCDCSVEFSPLWSEEANLQPACQCRRSIIPDVYKFCASCDRASASGPNASPRTLFNSSHLTMTSATIMGARSPHHFDGTDKATNFLRDKIDDYLEPVCPVVKGDSRLAFENVGDDLTLAVAATTPIRSGSAQAVTRAKGPVCISCGRSMSCSRCATKFVLSVVDGIFVEDDGVSASVTERRAGTWHSWLPFDEVVSWEVDSASSSGRCRECARKIYCLMCLEHMQEQTVGLRAIVNEGQIQDILRRRPSEGGWKGAFGTHQVISEAIAHLQPDMAQNRGRQDILQVLLQSQRPPEPFFSVQPFPVAASAIPRCRSGWGQDNSVGMRDIAERHALQVHENSGLCTERENWVARSRRASAREWVRTTCPWSLGADINRDPRGCNSAGPCKMSFLVFDSGTLWHALQVDTSKAAPGKALSTLGICEEVNHNVHGEFVGREDVWSAYAFTHPATSGVSGWGTSHLLQLQQCNGSVEDVEAGRGKSVLDCCSAVAPAEFEEYCQLLLGTTCTVERKDAHQAGTLSVGDGGATGFEQRYWRLISKHHVETASTRLGDENVGEDDRTAGVVEDWELKGFDVQYCSADISVPALQEYHVGTACSEAGKQKSSDGQLGDEDHDMLCLINGEPDFMYETIPIAPACSKVDREQKLSALSMRTALRQSRKRQPWIKVRDGWRDYLPEWLMPETPDCSQGLCGNVGSYQTRRAELNTYPSAMPSLVTRQIFDIAARVSSFQHKKRAQFPPRPQWYQIGRSCQASNMPATGGSSGLEVHPRERDIGRLAEGSQKGKAATGLQVGDPPYLLYPEAGFRRASATYRNFSASAATLGDCSKWEGKRLKPYWVQRQCRSHVSQAAPSVLAPFLQLKPKRQREGCEGYSEEEGRYSLVRRIGKTFHKKGETEQSFPNKKCSTLRFKQVFNRTAWNTPFLSSRLQEKSETAHDKAHFTHDCALQPTSTVHSRAIARSAAPTTPNCAGLLSKPIRRAVDMTEDPTRGKEVVSCAKALISTKTEELNSASAVTLPSFFYVGTGGTMMDDNTGADETFSKKKRRALGPWESRLMPGVVSGSGSGWDCGNPFSAPDQPTHPLLRGSESETVVCFTGEEVESLGKHMHLVPNLPSQQIQRLNLGVVDYSNQSATSEEVKRRRLEASLQITSAFTEEEEKSISSKQSSRMSSSTLSIGSTTSTRSHESAEDARRVRTVLHSRGLSTDGAVASSPEPCTGSTAWTWSDLPTSRPAQAEELLTLGQSPFAPLEVRLKTAAETSGLPQSPSAPFGRVPTLQKTDKRHTKLLKGVHVVDTSEVMLVRKSPGKIYTASDAEKTVSSGPNDPSQCGRALAYVPNERGMQLPSSQTARSESEACKVDKCSALSAVRAMPGTMRTGNAAGPEKTDTLVHDGSGQESNTAENDLHPEEQLLSNWISWQDEMALHQRKRNAGTCGRQPLALIQPPAMAAAMQQGETKFTEFRRHVAGICSAHSAASPTSAESMHVGKKKMLTSIALQEEYAAVGGLDREGAYKWRNRGTLEDFGIVNATPLRPLRQLGNKSPEGVACRAGSMIETVAEHPSCDKSTVPFHREEDSVKMEQTKGQSFVKRHRRAFDVDAVSSIEKALGSYAAPRAGGGNIQVSRDEHVVQGRDTDRDGALFSGCARPNAAAPDNDTFFYSSALSDRDTPCSKTPLPALQRRILRSKACGGKRVRVQSQTTEKLLAGGETRQSWIASTDAARSYDACGHKISGVWFDARRGLWRVVFTQGERRRTKGFSLRQYGFEQARHMAIQCKLAIEARKALCEGDFA